MPEQDAPTTEYKSKYAINPPTSATPRMSMLIWGNPGCGKTVLAATAPAKRLIIQFDPNGSDSLKKSDDNLVMDLSTQPSSIVEEAKSPNNPFGIDDLLKNNTDIQTVIVDSVTAFSTQAVAYSVGHRSAPGAVFENPSMSGYGFRNRFVLGLAKNLLSVTGKHNKHIIFLCHEDVPKTNDKGEILSITILLGGSLASEMPIQISEVWHLREGGKKRMITVREVGYRKPMKSRMFDTRKQVEFESTYDAIEETGITIDSLYTRWRENSYNKIALPPA
jgi:hypothetical protein